MNKLIFSLAVLLAMSCPTFHDLNANPTEIASDVSQVQERILWGAPISPYVRTVLVTLHEKGIPFTHHKTLPSKLLMARGQPIDKKFSNISPFGKIPAYEEVSKDNTHFAISESAVIIDYIDSVVTHTPL